MLKNNWMVAFLIKLIKILIRWKDQLQILPLLASDLIELGILKIKRKNRDKFFARKWSNTIDSFRN